MRRWHDSLSTDTPTRGFSSSLLLSHGCTRHRNASPLGPRLLLRTREQPPSVKRFSRRSHVVQRQRQLPRHPDQRTARTAPITSLLGLVPLTHSGATYQTQRRVVQPTPRLPGTTPADVQP